MADETTNTTDGELSWGPGAQSSDGQGGMRAAVEGAQALRDALERQGGESDG